MKIGARIFGALAGFLILFLLLGLLLPGEWQAEADTHLPAPPGAAFPFLNRMELWTRWMPTPDSGLEFSGPQEGVGAGFSWDDPAYGEGSVRVRRVEPNVRVEYEVEVEGGGLRIRGTLTLSAEGSGSRLHWTETGDFGWNPLLGYTARSMAASQGEAMRSSLEDLVALMSETSSLNPPYTSG